MANSTLRSHHAVHNVAIHRGRRVLVVEVSKSTQKIHKRLLWNLHHDVIDFSVEGSVGARLLLYVRDVLLDVSRNKSKGIDIILIPSILTDSNGPQTIQRLRRLGYKGLIFAVTSCSSPTEITTFLDSGADQFILKPMTTSKFIDAINGIQYSLTSCVEMIILLNCRSFRHANKSLTKDFSLVARRSKD